MLLAAVLISGQATGDGEVVGRITDIAGSALPGVRVSAAIDDERRETITDADGRFAIRSLRLGTYNVTVDLSGFFTRSGTVTLSPSVRRGYVGWRLEVGCLDDTVHIVLPPREAAPP